MWLPGGKQKSAYLKALALYDENTPLRVVKSLCKKVKLGGIQPHRDCRATTVPLTTLPRVKELANFPMQGIFATIVVLQSECLQVNFVHEHENHFVALPAVLESKFYNLRATEI